VGGKGKGSQCERDEMGMGRKEKMVHATWQQAKKRKFDHILTIGGSCTTHFVEQRLADFFDLGGN